MTPANSEFNVVVNNHDPTDEKGHPNTRDGTSGIDYHHSYHNYHSCQDFRPLQIGQIC